MLNWENKKILVTGGNGFLGFYLMKNLVKKRKISSKNVFSPSAKEFDLRQLGNCQKIVKGQNIVFHLAAHLGGVDYQRRQPAKIFYDNALMSLQLMESARQAGVEKFVTIGSVTAYPKEVKPPFKEKDLWKGFPEEANYAYALAKRLLAIQCRSYQEQYNFRAIHLILPNLYGPAVAASPSYSSHAIPIFMERLLKAKKENELEIKLSGTGKAVREFFYVEDAVEALLLATEKYNGLEPLNLGCGEVVTIDRLVKLLSRLIGFTGKIRWEKSGWPADSKRFLNSRRFRKLTNFRPLTKLEEGLQETVNNYVREKSKN